MVRIGISTGSEAHSVKNLGAEKRICRFIFSVAEDRRREEIPINRICVAYFDF